MKYNILTYLLKYNFLLVVKSPTEYNIVARILMVTKYIIVHMSKYFGEHSEVHLNIKLYKPDNCISEHNLLHLASELTSADVKILKFPMCNTWEISMF